MPTRRPQPLAALRVPMPALRQSPALVALSAEREAALDRLRVAHVELHAREAAYTDAVLERERLLSEARALGVPWQAIATALDNMHPRAVMRVLLRYRARTNGGTTDGRQSA